MMSAMIVTLLQSVSFQKCITVTSVIAECPNDDDGRRWLHVSAVTDPRSSHAAAGVWLTVLVGSGWDAANESASYTCAEDRR